jgi:AcrR family transcriptional regulator
VTESSEQGDVLSSGFGSRTTERARRNNPAGLAAIRKVARREFVASGFHAVSIRDLARKAGVSLSVLYHYYASKQELLYGVLNDAIDAFHEIHQRRMAEIGDPADPVLRFLMLVKITVEYRATLPEESLLFIREMRSLQPPFADRLAARRDEVARLYAEAIDEGVRVGAFRTPYPDDARRAVLAMLNAIPNWYRLSGELSLDALVARYQRLALSAVEYGGDLDAAVAPPSGSPNRRHRR